MLGLLLHAPRGPFYSPKAAKSHWRQSWKATVHVRCPIPFQIGRSRPLQIGGSWRTGHCPVHTGQSGAPYRPLERATRHPRIWRPTVTLAAVGSPDSPVHHRTVRWIIAVRRRSFPESGQFAGAGLAHRTLSGAPPDSPVHPDRAAVGRTQPILFQFFSSVSIT
jgi:hypothetical protein